MQLFMKLHHCFLIDSLQIFIQKKGIKKLQNSRSRFWIKSSMVKWHHTKTSIIGFRKAINGLFELERKCKKYFRCLIITILSRLHAKNWNVLRKLSRVVLTKRWKQDSTITNEWVKILTLVKVCFTSYLQLIVGTQPWIHRINVQVFWERPRLGLTCRYFGNTHA